MMRVWGILLIVGCGFAFSLEGANASARDCEGALSLPAERVFRATRGIREAAIGGNSIPAVVEKLIQADARRFTFWLQGLFRIDVRSYPEEAHEERFGNFEKWRVRVKSFEDGLGDIAEWDEYLEFAESVGAAPEAIAYQRERRAQEVRRLQALLLHQGWFFEGGSPGPMLDRLEEFAEANPWDLGRNREDARVQVARVLRKYAERIKEGHYDPARLQLGIHEIKKHLRWFLIYLHAYNGLFVLEAQDQPELLREYSQLPTSDVARGSFARLAMNPRVPGLAEPIVVPTHLYLALSKIVNELDEIKSLGENVEALVLSYIESGLAADEVAAKEMVTAVLESSGQSWPDWEAMARPTWEELQRTNLVEVLADVLDPPAF